LSAANNQCGLPPPMDLVELRRQVAQMPSISEICDRLEAALEITPTPATPTNAALTTPKSVGLSQADSGFGSPPFPIAADDDSDYDGDISGVEPLDDSFHDLDREPSPSISRRDGKGRAGLHAQTCFAGRDLPPPAVLTSSL